MAAPLLIMMVVASLLLVVPARNGPIDRHGWPHAVLATLLALWLGWLVLFATGDDAFWSAGRSAIVVPTFVIAGAAVAALVLCARSEDRARFRRPVLVLTVVACAMVWVAGLALTLGR